jgi:hypothetical protein
VDFCSGIASDITEVTTPELRETVVPYITAPVVFTDPSALVVPKYVTVAVIVVFPAALLRVNTVVLSHGTVTVTVSTAPLVFVRVVTWTSDVAEDTITEPAVSVVTTPETTSVLVLPLASI